MTRDRKFSRIDAGLSVTVLQSLLRTVETGSGRTQREALAAARQLAKQVSLEWVSTVESYAAKHRQSFKATVNFKAPRPAFK